MNEYRLRFVVVFCILFTFTARSSADLVVYTLPGSDLKIKLMGKVTVNVGATITLKSERGTLHFSLSDCQIVRAATNEQLHAKERAKAKREGTAKAYLDLALWCVEKGLLKEADLALKDAWELDPNNDRVKLMVQLTRYRRGTIPSSPSVEQEMREFVKNDRMKVARSRHFILLHDTSEKEDPIYGKSIANHRLDLLEQVYDSFFMKYALEGHPLRVPREPMRVVLFDDHADYLNFVRILSPSLKMAAGFYSPKENIAIFYRQKTDEALEGTNKLVELLKTLRETIRREQVAGGGEIIRFVKTIELLVDLESENQEIEVVTHEATHQLAANSGLLERESFQVRWAHEGLASYFESPKDARWAGIGAVNETRIGYYRILALDPENSNIELVVTDRVFDEAGDHFSVLAAYGQAWALTHFLMNRHLGKLIEFYKKMAVDSFETKRDEAWREKTLSTFKDCFGDLQKLDLEWRSYMRNLKTDEEILTDAM